jgi:uncharacterized protein DUF2190
MPIDATAFGYVSTLWDQPSPADSTNIKVGGYCVWGTATSTMNPNDIVIADSAADDSYKTTTSANSTSVVGYVVAGWGSVTGGGWDYSSAIASGQKILVLVKGVVLATASAAITRGARVGTSTTAGRVVTTTTQDASKGIALQTASAAGDQIRVLV